ncbi:MAG: GTPase Era [Lawsonibacter sp.]|nr:GTPase Era [Lawsonibacter sp.]
MAIQKAGIITIVGRPNVGKSTLTNALVGEKVAIVTHKPQTTRNRISGVAERGESQFVFVDTPGLHKARTRLGDYMVNVIRESVTGVDAVVLVVEPIPHIGGPEQELIGRIQALGCPAVLAINKADTLEKKEVLLEVIQVYSQAHTFDEVVPLSAKTGQGVEELLDVLERFLPEGPALFPSGMTSDQPERQMMAELLREKLLLCLDKEIPHGTAVEITRFAQRDDDVVEVEATIYCEKASHKGIIIGKGGTMLKKASTLARQDMEKYMGNKVYLQTWVKVKENWRDNPAAIQNFGYGAE